jgi:3-oxoacyl-(acyl-carrier-protein) synthase
MSEGGIAISGIGVVSPLGIGAAAFWRSLGAGTSAVAPPRSVQSTASAVAATPWTPHIVAANAALRSGDLTAASAASTEAYRAALASRRWEGLIEAADAHLRLAEAAGAPQAGVPRARELYLAALFRARDARSLEGVLRVAQAFDRLGDREAADHAMRVAQRM